MAAGRDVGRRPVRPLPLIPTTVIGSYPQPSWLIDRALLVEKGVPRTPATDVWRIAPAELEEALDAATLLAIYDQARAGIDIITDGEIRRESYFNHFANALDGVDRERLGEGLNRLGGRSVVPLVSGPIRRSAPVELAAAEFLRAATDRAAKVTVPGPFTLSQLAQNDHYPDQRFLALAYAEAIQEELSDLVAAGIDVVQLDEPYLQANADAARRFAVEAIDRAVVGIGATTVLHTCYGYAIYVADKRGGYPFLAELAECAVDQLAIEFAQPRLDPSVLAPLAAKTIVLGVLDLSTNDVEPPNVIADRLRGALEVVPPERLVAAPDCGMKFLTRAVAFAKLAALAEGAAMVRAEVATSAR
ncbi:MAG: 5-methyltetrahydropteroyltriglutamate--homocysteine methyltransferase [Acidimicrobiaceae bacterium]|jgi:5-methyltetrahydropteroyltriglutamate--homocysteine methyltransferase|nr:5-methyltetrahydropteroyltriglutamate--homocysteine methyltransferase [Acidimicrobiaceae bacterium]